MAHTQKLNSRILAACSPAVESNSVATGRSIVASVRARLRPLRSALRSVSKWVRLHRTIHAILRAENPAGAAASFTALSALGVRRVRRLSVAGAMLSLRTAAPDVIVARDTLRREFEPLEPLVDRGADGLVVDAGGYIGTAAIRLARLFPDATVVTVEPCRENFALLSANVAPFPNIVAVNAALSAEVGGGRRTLFDRGTGDVGFTLVARPADAKPARMYEVDVVTVGALMARFGAKEIAFLKMDVEGAEHELLIRRDAWLDDVQVLMIELHERIVAGCERAFARATTGRMNRRFGGEKHVSFRKPRCALAIAAE